MQYDTATPNEFEQKILRIIKEMEEGKYVFDGTVAELRSRYEHP